MSDHPVWRLATAADLDTIVAIQDRVHTLESEGREVFAAKLAAFPEGSRVLDGPGGILGYGVFHPWRLSDAPPLNNLPFVIPQDADCLFVHDVALLPAARRQGAARTLIGAARTIARTMRFARLALISVYDTAESWSRLGFVTQPLDLDAAKRAQYGDSARYMVAFVG